MKTYVVSEKVSKEMFTKYQDLQKDVQNLVYQLQMIAAIVQNSNVTVTEEELLHHTSTSREFSEKLKNLAFEVNTLSGEIFSRVTYPGPQKAE